MSFEQREVWMQEAFLANIPAAAVFLKCRNWALPTSRAIDLAEEAASEAYRRSLETEFTDIKHYRSWVTRVALNYAVDQLREQGRAVGLNPNDDATPGAPFSQNLELAEGLQNLAPQERLVLDLTFEQDLTLDEIAAEIYPTEPGSANAKRLRIKRIRDGALDKLRIFLSDARQTAFEALAGRRTVTSN